MKLVRPNSHVATGRMKDMEEVPKMALMEAGMMAIRRRYWNLPKPGNKS